MLLDHDRVRAVPSTARVGARSGSRSARRALSSTTVPFAPRSSIRRGTPAWVRRYALALVALEALAGAATGAVVFTTHQPAPSASLLWSAGALVFWPLLLAGAGAYSERTFGTGSDEYRRWAAAGSR